MASVCKHKFKISRVMFCDASEVSKSMDICFSSFSPERCSRRGSKEIGIPAFLLLIHMVRKSERLLVGRVGAICRSMHSLSETNMVGPWYFWVKSKKDFHFSSESVLKLTTIGIILFPRFSIGVFVICWFENRSVPTPLTPRLR